MAEKQDTRTPEEKQAAIVKASTDLETIITECGVTALAKQPPLLQTINLARGMQQMRALLKQSVVEAYFMPLQGSPLGFVTDKDANGGYTWEVVRDVVVEALLRGFRPIGNEFNIISGRFYGAKSGFERIVREFPGVSRVQYDLGVPTVSDKGALVPFVIRWTYDGREMELRGSAPTKEGEFDTRIPVKVNGGMGADAILGKATRKMMARVYQRLTGCAADIVEAEPGDGPAVIDVLPAPAPAAQDGRRISLKRNGAPASAPKSPIPHDPETGEVLERQPGED
jgi:hypothetical protein